MLTPRKRQFVKAYAANGGNGKAAALAAGYSPKNAKAQASMLLHRDLDVQQALWRIMNRRGLTEDKLLKELVADIETCNKGIKTAKRVISARVIVKSDDPSVKEEQATSRTDDFIEVDDHQAKIGYLREKQTRVETALKLRGHLTSKAPETQPESPIQKRILIVRAETAIINQGASPADAGANDSNSPPRPSV